MRFVMPTIGTRGDVQPYIALGQSLQGAGHTVTLATHPCMRSLVERYGVTFAPIGPEIDIGEEAARIRARAPHWMIGMLRIMQFTFRMLAQSHTDLLALCEQADVVIVSHTAAGSIEADQLGRPTVSVSLFPQAIPVEDPDSPILRRAIGAMAGWGMGLMMTRPLNRIRRGFGVPPMGPEGITSRTLNLLPVSPHVVEQDPRWEPRHQMTGYWFADPPEAWNPPDSLVAFLERHVEPVVVSLGAMATGGRDTQTVVDLTLSALQQVGRPAIIQGWDSALAGVDLPASIYHAGPVPHTWLLPRAACIVHHGGFGTTSAALRAGIPAIVVPHIIDQFYWGQRVFAVGAGPKPIPRRTLSERTLADALDQGLSDATYRSKANALGRLIRSETGRRNAVLLIEEAARSDFRPQT